MIGFEFDATIVVIGTAGQPTHGRVSWIDVNGKRHQGDATVV